MNSSRTGKTIVPTSVVSSGDGVGSLDQMLDAVVVGAPDPAASHAFLLVLSGTDPGRLHVLDRPEMVIGRSRFADIHISERALSQQHCKLTRHGENHRLFDLGSTNGTFVNDMRVQQADLKPGDVVRTGETVFTYMSGNHSGVGAGVGPGAGVGAPVGPAVAPGPGISASSGGYGASPPNALPAGISTSGQMSVSGSGPVHPASSSLVRSHPAAAPSPTMALARRPPQPLISVAEGGYAGSPQVLQVPQDMAAADDGPDLLARILWAIGFLRRYWLSILLCTMVGTGLGVASYKYLKPPARAEFEINLDPDASDNPVERARRANFEFFRSAQNNFKRPGLIHETLKQLGYTDVTADTIRGVQGGLEFNKVGEYTYKGAFSAPTADGAIAFLDVHLALYRDAEIDKALKVLLAEVQTLEAQLSQTDEQRISTNQAILAFKQEHSEGLPEKAAFHLQRELELGVERNRALGMLTRSSADAQVARKALRSEDPVLEARIEDAAPYATSIANLDQRLAEARAIGKGPEHPDVVSLEAEKRSLESKRDKILREGTTKVTRFKNPAYRTARGQLDEAEAAQRVAQADLARVTKELEEAEGIVDKLPRLQAEFLDLSRNQTTIQRQYDELFSQLNSTRVRLDLERAQAAARYEVITPPNVIPVSRLKTLIIRGGIGLFLGLFLGLGLGALRELRRYVTARLAAVRR